MGIAVNLPDPVVSSVNAVAKWFRVDVRTVHNWKNNGMPGASGAYNLQDITDWRLARVDARTSAADTDIDQEELLDKRAARRLKEIKIARTLGELVDRATIVAQERQKAAIVRARLQAFPGELASNIPPEIRPDVMVIAENTVDGLLRELSECQPQLNLKPIGSQQPTKRQTSGRKSSKSTPRGRSPKGSRGRKSE